MKIKFRREENYKSNKSRAMKTKLGKIVYDGTPSVADPLGQIRGVTYYLWFQPLGWSIQLDHFKSNIG